VLRYEELLLSSSPNVAFFVSYDEGKKNPPGQFSSPVGTCAGRGYLA